MKSSHPLEREELMAWMDGELRPERAEAAAAHLEHCAECRATVADLRELSKKLAAWKVMPQPLEMPDALSSAIDAHVTAQKRRATDQRRSWRQVLGTRRLIWAGAVICGMVLLIMITGPKTSQHLMLSSNKLEFRLERLENQKRIAAASGKPMAYNNTYNNPYNPTSSSSLSSAIRSEPSDISKMADDAEKPAISGGPMIVRTAQLFLITKDFNQARASAEEIVKRHGGYIGELNVNTPENSGRTLNATFRVPSPQLDAVLAELKKLGRVTSEQQGGNEVTQQYTDLQARLANARHTEQRLSDLLRDRTGMLSDVLTFEKEIDRVRGEIESMEAQRKSLAKQVEYATLNATLSEEYGAPLQLAPPSTSTRFRNAAVEGYESLSGGIVSLLLFLLSAGPSILVWGAILFFGGRLIWKRVRRQIA
jgi:hypothetical protein